jgi:PKD repeat protein
MKRLIFVSVLFITQEVNLFAQINLNNGLAAYYPFNGNANDESGNGNNPVFNNASLTSDKFGKAKSAYHFNGSNQYMRIRNNPSINFGNKITISAVVRVSGFYEGKCHGNRIIMKGDGDGLDGNYTLTFDDNAFTGGQNCYTEKVDKIHQNFYGPYTSNPSNGYKPNLVTNKWYNLVYTSDGVNVKFFVDCELKSYGQIGSANFSNEYDLFFGKLNNYQYPYWFNGDLDEIRIYNRALNESEILALCEQPKPIENTSPSATLEYSVIKCNEVKFSVANAKNIKNVKWQLGDKATSTKENFTHVYKKDGSYDVVLTITGKDGETKKITKAILIQKPIANFSFKSNSSNPLKIQFKNISKENVNYKWLFGDGQNLKSNTTKTFTHTYAGPGTYVVGLVAEDKAIGCTNIFNRIIVIEKPTASVTTGINLPTDPKTLTTDNLPTIDILPEKRIDNLVRQIEVTHDSIQVSFYDNGDIDGDSITVSYNNKIITQHLLLTANGKTFTIKVEPTPAQNELIMYAENLGSIPPNTALMIIYDGTKRYEVNISSSESSNGKVSFTLKR